MPTSARMDETSMNQVSPPRQSTSGSLPPVNQTLAPSVEYAYKKKCVELKRRLNEIEKHNDDERRKKFNLDTAIRKLKLERAILLDQLGKIVDMTKPPSVNKPQPNGHARGGDGEATVVDTADSTSHPVAKEKSSRQKRPQRQASLPTLLPTPAGQTTTFQVQTPSNMASSAQHGTQITYSTNSVINSSSSHGNSTRTNSVPISNSDALHAEPPDPAAPVRPLAPLEEFISFEEKQLTDKDYERRSRAEIERQFQRKWNELDEHQRSEWESRYEEKMKEYEAKMDAYKQSKRNRVLNPTTAERDSEDVDMKESSADSEPVLGGGFTAVNR